MFKMNWSLKIFTIKGVYFRFLNLNRPSWLMSRRFGLKVRSYSKKRKLWAIVGVVRQTNALNDPGVYAKYHESGWAAPGRKTTVPHKFLAKAYFQNRSEFTKEVLDTYEEVRKIYSLK